MRHLSKLCMIVAAVVLPACAAAQEGNAAKRVWVPETGFTEAKTKADGKTPPGFTLVLQTEMPTPGWTFRVDSVNVDPEGGRITAKITEQAPAGMTAQVITPTKIELPLGTVPAGAYFVELWTRRNETTPHQPAHAVILIAR